ncbi:hypothetical protein [Psychrobacter sp. AOP7-A1-24]|uniref:hypothetical protein n=1 Tax=Psychrobacter sp. AOP7-A1-24 TaxID=3457646 RepID=UPI00402BC487
MSFIGEIDAAIGADRSIKCVIISQAMMDSLNDKSVSMPNDLLGKGIDIRVFDKAIVNNKAVIVFDDLIDDFNRWDLGGNRFSPDWYIEPSKSIYTFILIKLLDEFIRERMHELDWHSTFNRPIQPIKYLDGI